MRVQSLRTWKAAFDLEVSGISAGVSSDVKRRLREKVTQAARGKSNLPAMAAVVGFKALEVAISPLGEAE
jgi:hypothetical protein